MLGDYPTETIQNISDLFIVGSANKVRRCDFNDMLYGEELEVLQVFWKYTTNSVGEEFF